MENLIKYSCVSYFHKWDKCIKEKNSKKCQKIFDNWVDCHKKNKQIKSTNDTVSHYPKENEVYEVYTHPSVRTAILNH